MDGRRRRSSQIQGSDDGDGATRPSRRRRRATSPEVPEEADTLWESLPLDMLWEILLRLPPEPTSLLRASGVSTLWRGIATDRNFMSQFRRSPAPPLHGFFVRRQQKLRFTPVLHPPEGIPAERIHIPYCMSACRHGREVSACRHGRVLAIYRQFVVVFAPLTGEEHNLPFPPDEFGECNYHNASVLCAASGQDHVHGFCHKSPFKVALLSMYPTGNRFIASVYSSETDKWGGLLTIDAPFKVALADVPATLVGNVLYWMLSLNNACAAMLEFDLDTQNLTVIKGPSGMIANGSHRIIKTEEGTVGWVRFSFPSLEIWQRKKNCTTWLQLKTVDMHDILGIPPRIRKRVWHCELLGYEEDNNVIILYVDDTHSAYMVDLKSMQSTILDGSSSMNHCHPLTSFYLPEMAI